MQFFTPSYQGATGVAQKITLASPQIEHWGFITTQVCSAQTGYKGYGNVFGYYSH